MEVVLAKTAGFCFGVKRAVDKVYEQTSNENVYTYGPIIHNEEVVADLEKHGIKVLHSPQDIEQLEKGIVIIRSHGVEKSIYDLIESKGLKLVDATCPFVRKIHSIVKRESEAGKAIVIIGSDNHPEVEGIKGWSSMAPVVIETEKQVDTMSIPTDQKVCIVSQTTFNYNKFKDLVEIISKKGYDINVFNTICNATEERQTEAKAISTEVDAMIVIGGKHSSNTQKLYEISKKECENTYYIQTLDDLDFDMINESIRSVGITAGASTPNKIIKEVHSACQK